MPLLNIKPTHKPIKDYYATLQQYNQQEITHEGKDSQGIRIEFHIYTDLKKRASDLLFDALFFFCIFSSKFRLGNPLSLNNF